MGRRVLNRKELRADFDAAERQKPDEDDVEDGEEGDEDEDEDEEGDEDASADDEADDEAGDEDDEEEKPKKRKPAKEPKPKAKPKPKARPRSRTAKVTRMKAIWAVFNNSNQRVATFDYPKRQDAYDKAAQLTTDKKSTHFVQMVKEPIEEKKE